MSGSGDRPGWALTPGWVKALLIASLALNVGVVGLVGGTAMRGEKENPYSGKPENEPGLDRRQSRILRMVPEVRREAARNVILSRTEEYDAARSALRQAQMDLVEAIRSEPYQPERVRAALSARRAASGTVWGIGYEQLAEIADSLDPVERSELAAQLEERTKRWMERQEAKPR